MTQNDEQDGKLTLRRPGRLELKKTVETGQVRQSFSHGRTKSVTVEVKKKRTFERGVGGNMRAVSESANPVQTTEVEEGGVPDLGNLTEEERAAQALVAAGVVHLAGSQERSAALACQQRAHVLLLVDHPRPWPATNVPGKLYEYMAAERPVLALAHPTPN